MRTDASPGEGAETASRPLIGDVRTHHVREKILNDIRSPWTLFWFHVKPAFTRIRYEFPCELSSAVRGRHTEVSLALRSCVPPGSGILRPPICLATTTQ